MSLKLSDDDVDGEEIESSNQNTKALARNMATNAQVLAANPLRNFKTFIQFKLLTFFLKRRKLLSTKRYDKYTRLAARRDPSRFTKFVDSIDGVQTTASSVIQSGNIRSADFASYDADLKQEKFDVRLIAFYLPQFHPFPENDTWWGKGFTEWTNVGKALPLFEGHYQPHCPIHFGYYDLRLNEIMEDQSKIAQQYGISGFAHHFYWFGGKTLMELPLRKMLANQAIDIPFCLSWANENWTRRWDGKDSEVLIEQSYSSDDARKMILYLFDYFKDPRYIRINGRPLFLVYHPKMIPDVEKIKEIWQDEAIKLGVGPLYIVGAQKSLSDDFQKIGFDASVQFPPHGMDTMNLAAAQNWFKSDPSARVYNYESVADSALSYQSKDAKVFRSVTLSWDNTARRQTGATILVNFSIRAYRDWLSQLCQRLRQHPDIAPDEKIIFINAWNEWAEGTHLEPDQRFGFAYLAATRQALTGPSGDLPS